MEIKFNHLYYEIYQYINPTSWQGIHKWFLVQPLEYDPQTDLLKLKVIKDHIIKPDVILNDITQCEFSTHFKPLIAVTTETYLVPGQQYIYKANGLIYTCEQEENSPDIFMLTHTTGARIIHSGAESVNFVYYGPVTESVETLVNESCPYCNGAKQYEGFNNTYICHVCQNVPKYTPVTTH